MPATNKTAPKYSILIVSYKSGDDLKRLFDCLGAQTCQNFETILIDNASPTNGVDEVLAGRANIFVQNTENIGFACANNQAAKLAHGEWLVLLNPDAFPADDWLHEIDVATGEYDAEAFGSLQLLDDDPNLLDGMGDNYSISGIAWRGGHRKPKPEIIKDGECFSPCAAAAVWKKSVFEELGGFEESFNSYFEDVDLGFRHRLLGGKCIQLGKALVRHRASGSSSRYSEYAVFHGTRNRLWAFIRLMPSWIMWVMLPVHILATLLLWLQSSLHGAGSAYGRGLWAAITGIKQSFRGRNDIQKKRTASIKQILSAMSFSPVDLLLRKIVLWEIEK
jgi:GT2 family glycosyltransferase